MDRLLSFHWHPIIPFAHSGATKPEAEALLLKAEAVAGELGLFAEEVDARSKAFLGNTPLLFAQMEYVRAVVELAKARPLDTARMMVGKARQRVRRFLSSDEPGDMQEHG